MNVERLAPFFEAFRFGLTSMAQRSNPRICLLTPGPFNETYFEQAYLARYLGLLLVEGGDLTMRDGKVHVRTIAGLKRADVIWRRIDSDFADPLELNARSRLGVPGLVDALREGGVVIANALGSGVLEAPAMMSFVPKLCRTLLGEDLRLPNIATWWCGHGQARRSVVADMDELAIAGAYRQSVLGFARNQPLIGAALDCEEKRRLAAAMRRARRGFRRARKSSSLDDARVATMVGSSRGPSFCASMRRARRRWRLCRAGSAAFPAGTDARAVSMGEGVHSADVWVLADKPVADGQFAAHWRDRSHPPHHGHLAKPGRGQSLLARALYRALGSDLAADPLPRRRALKETIPTTESCIGGIEAHKLARCVARRAGTGNLSAMALTAIALRRRRKDMAPPHRSCAMRAAPHR